MSILRIWPVLALVGPLFAQMGEYTGPAVLSRGGGGGVAPAAPIAFRPYVNLSALYNNGLGVTTDSHEPLASKNVAGGEVAAGLYGYHSWKQTVLGVNYRGDYRRYSQKTSFDGTSQFLTLGLMHHPSKKISLTLREALGTFTQNTGYMGTFGFFDPTFAQIPQNELLDTRTDYLSTMADLTYIRTPRLSFNFGGSGFMVRRRVSSFYGVTGASGRADMAYRLTRGTTIGVDYFFTHFEFNKIFGAADLHSAAVNYSARLSRRWEIRLRAGVLRVEMLSQGRVAVDPAIAAIIGRTTVSRAFYALNAVGMYEAQLQREFRRASFYARFSNGVSPGNGVYLTSRQNTGNLGYSYTGMRHWSLSAHGYYSDMRSVGEDIGRYRTAGVGLGAARSISRNVYFTARADGRRYLAAPVFRRNLYNASVGIAYSPGDVPLRLW